LRPWKPLNYDEAMLEGFRRHAYSWGTRALLIALFGVFIVYFGATSFQQFKPVASVDCYTYLHLFTLPGCRNILPDEIDREAGDIKRTVQNSRSADAAHLLAGVNLRQMAVESLVEQTLIENEAHRLGLTISDDELGKAIASQTVFQADGRFSTERYEQVLRDNDLEPAAFESMTRGKMLANVLRFTVNGAIAVSAEEVRAEFNRFGQKISLQYIEFPYANFATDKPSDQEITKFYHSNEEAFREPDRAKISFIRYDPAALAPKEIPPDADLQNFYNENLKALFSHPAQIHVRHILINLAPDASAAEKAAARAEAEDLMQKIKSGASFADLAKASSDDPGSKANGGDLGEVSRGELVPEFEDVAFKLKPGELGLAQTKFGFHVIQVEDVKGAKIDTFEEARAQIVTLVQRKQGETLAKQDLNQDVAAAGLGHDLKDLAKKRGLIAIETSYVADGETIKGAEDTPSLAKEALAMQPGDVHPITTGPTPFLVKLIDRKSTRIPPLSEIKDRVAQTMTRMRAEAAAAKAANAMLQRVKAPGAFDAVVAASHLAVKTTGEFVRATGEIPGLGSFREPVEAAATVTSLPGMIGRVMENGGNSYIFRVVGRSVPDDADWRAMGPEFTARFIQQQRQLAWSNFVNGLKQHALIVVHSDLIGAPSANS
jgi:peptidyl-prolyl cis-trans isomerase D